MLKSCRVWHSKGSMFAGTQLYSPLGHHGNWNMCESHQLSLTHYQSTEWAKISIRILPNQEKKKKYTFLNALLNASQVRNSCYDSISSTIGWTHSKPHSATLENSQVFLSFNYRGRELELSCAVTLRSRAESLRKWRRPWRGEGHKKAHFSRLKDK